MASVVVESIIETPTFISCKANLKRDSVWWAVWLGRHAGEKISPAPKGQLREVRNLPLSVRAKAGLIGFRIARNPGAKAWSSEPLCASR